MTQCEIMSKDIRKYVTVREIDGRKGIDSPHERELKSIEEGKLDFFLNRDPEAIKETVETVLKGLIENIGFNEDYTVSFEFFPEVNAHILHYNFKDEEDEAFGKGQLKFLFSGERVLWVPSEDLASLIDLSLDCLEDLVTAMDISNETPLEKSDLLNGSIDQRSEPFIHLKPEQLNDLAAFVGGNVEQEDDTWRLIKTYFLGVKVALIYDMKKNSLDIEFGGENITKVNNYAKDQLGIFLLNHCLRFISVTYPDIKMPEIVIKIFSFAYQKSHF